jgi:hypothetical protein
MVMDEPAPPEVSAPAAGGGAFGAALLRLPDHLLGGFRALALEMIVILGIGALAALVHYLARGTPHLFADIWTAGTYFCFMIGAPLAGLTLLDDLRHPDLIDWWPGGTSTRTRFRLPSTSVVYLGFDAVPILLTYLFLREPPSHGLIGYLLAVVAVGLSLGIGAWRVAWRLRHGPMRRPPEASASLEVAPTPGRTAAAAVGMLGAPAAGAATLAATHASALTWVLGAVGYLVFAALLKVALAVPPEPLVASPAATVRRRGRKRS